MLAAGAFIGFTFAFACALALALAAAFGVLRGVLSFPSVVTSAFSLRAEAPPLPRARLRRVSLRPRPRAGFDPEDGVAVEGCVVGVFFLFLFFSGFLLPPGSPPFTSSDWGLVSCTGGD